MYTRRADASGGDEIVINHSRDGESRFTEICAILSVGCALSTIAVSLRSYTRLVLLRSFGPDDGVMVAAQVLTIASAIAIGLESKYGLGSHTWMQPKEHFVPYMKAFYSSVVVYNVSMCLVKISILLQYRRIFNVRMMQLVTFYGVAFLSAWAITLCFLLTLICIPVAKFWHSTIPGKCLDPLSIWYTMAGCNLATDFAIFGLPLPMIRSLQLPRKQKLMLSAVFSLGLFTCIISIIRIRSLRTAALTDDPNWDNVDAATWSFMELTIAVLAACLPTLRPIFSKILPRLFTSSLRRSHGRSKNGASHHAHNSSLNANTNNSRARKPNIVKSESIRSLREQESIEMATHESKMVPSAGGYSISVTSGMNQSREEAGLKRLRDEDEEPTMVKGGIQTTTVITLQVAPENRKQDG